MEVSFDVRTWVCTIRTCEDWVEELDNTWNTHFSKVWGGGKGGTGGGNAGGKADGAGASSSAKGKGKGKDKVAGALSKLRQSFPFRFFFEKLPAGGSWTDWQPTSAQGW